MIRHVSVEQLQVDVTEIVLGLRAEDEIVVTVSDEPVARIVPVRPGRWRMGRDIAHIFETPVDPTWQTELASQSDVLDDAVRDSWETQS